MPYIIDVVDTVDVLQYVENHPSCFYSGSLYALGVRHIAPLSIILSHYWWRWATSDITSALEQTDMWQPFHASGLHNHPSDTHSVPQTFKRCLKLHNKLLILLLIGRLQLLHQTTSVNTNGAHWATSKNCFHGFFELGSLFKSLFTTMCGKMNWPFRCSSQLNKRNKTLDTTET